MAGSSDCCFIERNRVMVSVKVLNGYFAVAGSCIKTRISFSSSIGLSCTVEAKVGCASTLLCMVLLQCTRMINARMPLDRFTPVLGCVLHKIVAPLDISYQNPLV